MIDRACDLGGLTADAVAGEVLEEFDGPLIAAAGRAVPCRPDPVNSSSPLVVIDEGKADDGRRSNGSGQERYVVFADRRLS
ncbi:MAG TPA: hypothetical protein VMZ31_09625 [Phycisphaerae bacterium]|nr:hypothetical protein [Phycisphaerae bacterium]